MVRYVPLKFSLITLKDLKHFQFSQLLINGTQKVLLTYATTVFPAELKVKREVDFKTTPLSTDPSDFSDCTDKWSSESDWLLLLKPITSISSVSEKKERKKIKRDIIHDKARDRRQSLKFVFRMLNVPWQNIILMETPHVYWIFQ